jgi:hypothetical protein
VCCVVCVYVWTYLCVCACLRPTHACAQAFATFLQLITLRPPSLPNYSGPFFLPIDFEVHDQPFKKWRGLMLDVARHYAAPEVSGFGFSPSFFAFFPPLFPSEDDEEICLKLQLL